MELTEAQSEHVQALIQKLMVDRSQGRHDAVRELHLYVCRGKCSWYRQSGGSGTNFDFASQMPQEREKIGKLVAALAEEREIKPEELLRWFHLYRCHS